MVIKRAMWESVPVSARLLWDMIMTAAKLQTERP